MSIIARIAGPLKSLTDGTAEVESTASDIATCLEELGNQFPKLKDRLWNEQGELDRSIAIYINGNDIRFLQQLDTPLEAGDEISIIPAMAGG